MGDQERVNPLVRITLPATHTAGEFDLMSSKPRRVYPLQRLENSNEHLGIVYGTFPRDTSHAFTLTPRKPDTRTRQEKKLDGITQNARPPSSRLTLVAGEKSIKLLARTKPVLTYNKAVRTPPDGISPLYQRSGHIHPVRTPSGKMVSDEFPSDHLHQHALFAAWVKTEFDGHPVDFWNQKKGQGTVEHRRIISQKTGPVFSTFTVELAHVDLTNKDAPVDVIKEQWTVRLFIYPGLRLFEIDSVQTVVAKSHLLIQKHHYGGMAFRGSSEWIKSEHDFLTSEGKNRIDGNHSRPNWATLFGKVDGEACGIAMFSHPKNLRSPQPIRLHPTMPYFVYSPCVLGEIPLKPGESIHSQYRFVTYDGEPDAAHLNQLWQDYAKPVMATASTPQQHSPKIEDE